MIGQRFGRWIVLAEAPKRPYGVYWKRHDNKWQAQISGTPACRAEAGACPIMVTRQIRDHLRTTPDPNAMIGKFHIVWRGKPRFVGYFELSRCHRSTNR